MSTEAVHTGSDKVGCFAENESPFSFFVLWELELFFEQSII